MKKRVTELSDLIDEAFQSDFLQTTLGFPPDACLDKDKLAVSGHGLGGMASIALAMEDKRVKLCLPMDPWFFPFKRDLQTISLKNTPVLLLTTETWN